MQPPAFQDHDYDVPEQSLTHWREYVRIFWEWKWVTITALAIATTFGMISNFKAVPIYQAVARLQVDSTVQRIVNFQEDFGNNTRDFDYLNTQVRVMQSRLLAERVVKALELSKNPDFLPEASQQADFVGALQRCISVQLVRGTRIIEVSVEHPNPKMTALIANSVVQEFIKQNMEIRLTATMDAIRWLGEQSKDYKVQLQKSEAAVQEYREKTRDVSLEDSYNIVLDKLKSMSSAVGTAKMDRLAAETEWKQAETQLAAKQDSMDLIPAIASDEDVAALRLQLTQKQIAISVLRERYKDKYPAMAAALSEQKEIESRLKQACNTAADKIKTRYLMAKAKEESLRQPLMEQETQALELSRKLVEYSALKRNAESDRQLYENLLTRMKQAGVTGKLEVNDVRIIDPALVPGEPVRPNKTRTLIYMVVLGLFAGFGLSYGAHIYDDKIKTYKDIESYLGMPLLCEVPRIEVKSNQERATIANVDPHSLAGEAFSGLRATIGSILTVKDAKILMVTSTALGEGKSLVSSNLAIAFARDNLRTLLIDADLRHPSIQKDYELDDAYGLSQYMTNGCKKEDIVHKTAVANLDIITAGKIAVKPAELLGSARMRELVEEMSERYDRIVVDTPPVAAVSDAIVLLPLVQGVVFVTHFRKIRRDVVARAVKKLREMGAPLIGNVLNNIDLKKDGYYYYPYHHSYRNPYYYSDKESGNRRAESSKESGPKKSV